MKLNKKFTVDEKEYIISSDNLVVESFSAGRGIIIILSTLPVYGICKYYIGYNGGYSVYFTGYVEKCIQLDNKRQRLYIREFIGVLDSDIKLSLRNIRAEDLFKKLSDTLGIDFIIEKNDWNSEIIPYLFNLGSGFGLLDFLGNELQINNFIYFQTPKGKIYFGSRDKSLYGKLQLEFPVQFISQINMSSAAIPILPDYRPGIKVKIGTNNYHYINKVEITAENMRIYWA